jgi:citrate lyase beta subunit
VRHFGYLDRADDDLLFHVTPREFNSNDSKATLEMALGATLYMPGTRPTICRDIGRNRDAGSTSMVLCLEDAIRDEDVACAEANIVEQLRELAEMGTEPPLLFIRVRTAEQLVQMTRALGDAAFLLAGFVLPKFTPTTGPAYLDALHEACTLSNRHIYAMPVLESPEILHTEVRREALVATHGLLDQHRDHILAVRVGATDLCGLYGLRREREFTIWDIAVVREALADIVNIFGRGGSYVVTGAVWEYFSSGERIFKPQVRQGPFIRADLPHAPEVRSRLVANDLDGLLREVALDKANGILGKTVIHPSHVRLVHAMSVVTHEEYVDATAISELNASSLGGVMRSEYLNKMIEGKPHLLWAIQTLRRAAAFGVLARDRTFVDLLDQEWRHA